MDKAAMKRIEKMAIAHGLKDFKWIRPRSVILGRWVRMKCNDGCPGYGKRGTCPPEVPSVADCINFFKEYRHGLPFHFAKKFKDPPMRNLGSREANQKMLDLEREVFLSGYHKAFIFPQASCRLCRQCKGIQQDCRHPYLARPKDGIPNTGP